VTERQGLGFGPFELLPDRKMLLEGGRPCKIGSRALDLLTVLATSAGEVLSKDELIARVWPGIFVDENNLRVHIVALRKILGEGRGGARYIANVVGRGYCFVATVTPADIPAAAPVPAPAPAARPAPDLPQRLTRIVGRDDTLRELAGQLGRQRLVTIVGPGGIGKTTVALALGEASAADYDDGVRLVELAPLTDPGLVPSTLATALGLPVLSGDPLPNLVAFLRDRRMLILLDNCEHVIDAAAILAEALLRGAPDIRILATSREPLRAEGEAVLRLRALDMPPEGPAPTVEAALGFAAVELFAERATASLDSFTLTAADVPVVVEICRRLDGMPLAIELAAARIDTLGLRRIAAGLDDRFRLLNRGRRTALPRHQTLRATLDWSYDILPEAQQVVLERLAWFADGFGLDSAIAVAGCAALDEADVIEAVAELAAKSLLTVDATGEAVRYRLLELTGAYALEKLQARGAAAATAARHAAHVLDLLGAAEAALGTMSRADWRAGHRDLVGDVRRALDWAWGTAGQADEAIALTAAAIPLWMQSALYDECRSRVLQALAADEMPADAAAMRLQLARALTGMLTHKGAVADIYGALDQARQLAEALDDGDYRRRVLWALWLGLTHGRQHRRALGLAERFRALATGTIDEAIGERLIGDTLHCLGDQTGARRHFDAALARLGGPGDRLLAARFHFDQGIVARISLAHVLWLQGLPDRALAMAEAATAAARAAGDISTFGASLGYATCRIALLNGRLDAAARHIADLLDLSAKYAITVWSDWGRCFQGLLLTRQGAVADGLEMLRPLLARDADPRFLHYFACLGDIADALIAAGETDHARSVVDGIFARLDGGDERWCWPDFLRLKGELTGSEDLLAEALALARDQGALALELRAATALARLRGRDDGTLATVYGRFIEGFGTTDLMRAAALIS